MTTMRILLAGPPCSGPSPWSRRTELSWSRHALRSTRPSSGAKGGWRAVAGIGIGTILWGTAGCFGIQGVVHRRRPWMYLTLKDPGGRRISFFMGLQTAVAEPVERPRRATQSPSRSLRPQRSPAIKLGLNDHRRQSAIRRSSVASISQTTVPAHEPLWFSPGRDSG